jgi:hypothetical protein
MSGHPNKNSNPPPHWCQEKHSKSITFLETEHGDTIDNRGKLPCSTLMQEQIRLQPSVNSGMIPTTKGISNFRFTMRLLGYRYRIWSNQ